MFSPFSLNASPSAIAQKSLIKIPPNAIVHYAKVTGPAVLNQSTGNYEAPQQVVDIPALVRERKSPDLISGEARFSERIELMGYLQPVNMSDMDGLDFSLTCRLSLNSLNGRTGKVTGEFTFVIKPNPFEKEINIVVGVPIEGVLVLANSGKS